jgi:aspartyl-tRNA(Asn)/glutamyl-tRNA(Gln) amidotransferase subunit A
MAKPDHTLGAEWIDTFASISQVAADIRDGRVSPVALADACLARIAALDPTLNMFITVTADLAHEQARRAGQEIAAGTWRGPLHGIPVAVKDFYDTAGIRTTAAFEPFRNRVPSEDAEMVVKLRDAGAVLVGKTNMHRLGMGTTSLESAFGPVMNPWNVGRVAGGSSGGSCVAVASGMCFATVDTDAVGSGRLPAAICGVTCHKPTFGALSPKGILAGEEADPAILKLSHPCVTARSADDVSLVFEVLTQARRDERAAGGHLGTLSPEIRRLGVVTNFTASAEVRAAFDRVVATLATMRIEQRDVSVPFDAASFDVGTIDADRASISASLFADVDALVLPTLTTAAPTVDEARTRGDLAVAPDNTFFCNYYGLPATTVPAGFDANGVPLGVQLVGPRGADDRVLGLARAYQRESGWRYAPPPGVVASESRPARSQ